MTYNAPGKHHREGLSLVDVTRMFPDNDTAEAWIASIRWPDGPRCPHCDSDNVLTGAAHKTMPYRYRTKDCRKRFSVRVGTVLQDSKLGYQTWALAIYLMTTELKGRASMKLRRRSWDHSEVGMAHSASRTAGGIRGREKRFDRRTRHREANS